MTTKRNAWQIANLFGEFIPEPRKSLCLPLSRKFLELDEEQVLNL